MANESLDGNTVSVRTAIAEEDCGDDWTFLSLHNTLISLCAEAPYFKRAMKAAVQAGGRDCNSSDGPSPTKLRGDYTAANFFLRQLQHCGPYALAYRRGGTLSFILYADGITPGAVLSPDNKRKAVVWYGSFIEFRAMLAYEEMWVSLAVARIAFKAHRVRGDYTATSLRTPCPERGDYTAYI